MGLSYVWKRYNSTILKLLRQSTVSALIGFISEAVDDQVETYIYYHYQGPGEALGIIYETLQSILMVGRNSCETVLNIYSQT